MLENKNVQVIAKWLGGSHLYKLNTAQSDMDERGIFINTSSSYILGLNRFDEERKQVMNGEDIVLKELSHFMRLLAQSNTEALESIWCKKESLSFISPEFEHIRAVSCDLIDSERFFKSLSGYAQGELRLTLGARVGVLGSKRKKALDELGYSFKNATNLLRLFYTGIFFFKEGRYIVDCHDFGNEIYDKIFKVKTEPEKFDKEWVQKEFDELDKQLKDAFDNRKESFKFNQDIANKLLLSLYFPYLDREFREYLCK